METEPDEVTVIVIGARGLRGKKAGRHKYSVIFGIGNKKYRTGVVKEPSGCPEWNEESVVHVGNPLDQVFFIVTEKDDVLGQLNLPITSLQGPPGRTMRSNLQPHKKCPEPNGELIYQCYISYRRPVDTTPSHKSSPLLKGKRGRRGSLSAFNKKISRSIHDLLGFGSKENLNDSKSKRSYSISNGLDNSGKIPVITKVTPSIGLASGGTRITIEGHHLGFSKSDILDLTICESNCEDYIEYESQSRIYVTTQKTLPGKGDIILETESGGLGTLRGGFMFVEKMPEEGSTNPFEEPPGPNPFGEEEQEEEEEEDEDMKKVLEECRSSPKTPVKALPLPPLHSTLPKVCSSSTLHSPASPLSKKHFIKHLRRASEGHFQPKPNGPVAAGPPAPKEPQSNQIEMLQTQVKLLMEQNAVLTQDNKDMKAYIDKLIAKVLQHCPEALASD